MAGMNIAELEELIEDQFPQAHGFSHITNLTEDTLELRLPFHERHLRPGNTVSGPTLMTLADTGGYYLVMSRLGPVVHAVTTNLNINIMRKPRAEDVIALVRLLKLGKQLAVVEVHMRSISTPEIVAQATVTYSIPPAAHAPK